MIRAPIRFGNLFSLLVALASGLFVLGACQRGDETRGVFTKATDYSYDGLSAHDPAACPRLRGVYMPEDRMGTQFQFTERGGFIVISTKSAGSFGFSEVIVVSGVSITYGNGDTAAAKCVAGQIVMQNVTTGGGRTQVNLEPTAQGFSRSVWRPRNRPVVTQYFQQ